MASATMNTVDSCAGLMQRSRTLAITALAACLALIAVGSALPKALLLQLSAACLLGISVGAGALLIGRRPLQTSQTPPSSEPEQAEPTAGEPLLERINQAAEPAGILIFDWDVAGRQLIFDPAQVQLYSAAAREVAGDPLEFTRRIVHPDDLVHYRNEMARALKDQSRFTFTYRELRANDAVRPVHLYGHVLRDATGRAVRVLGVTADRTAELEAERKQHELLERLHLATQVGGLGVWDWDLLRDRMILDAAFARAHGDEHLILEDNARQRFTATVHADDLAMFNRSLDAALAEGDTLTQSYRVIISGRLVHVRVSGKIFRDAAGRAVRVLGVSVNVNAEVQRAEQALRQAEAERTLRERLDLVTQTTGIALWQMDLTTRCIRADAAMHGLLECAEGALDEAALLRNVHADDRDRLQAALSNVAPGDPLPAPLLVRHSLECANGEQRHLQSHIRVLHSIDHARYVLGATSNVTREVEAAEALQRAQQRIPLDRLTMAMRAANLASWEADLDTGKLVWSDNPIKTLDAGAGMGSAVADYEQGVYPEDRNNFKQVIRVALQTQQELITCRYRACGDDGTCVHVEAKARLLYDESGRARRLLGISRDITAEVEAIEPLQRQAQQWRDAERRLERASLSSSVGHWESSLLHGGIWFSSSFHALLGYPDGALSTGNDALMHLVHTEDASANRQALRAHLTSGTPYLVDSRLRTHSGEYSWFRLRGSAARNAAGQPVTMAGSVQDIHQQKLIENALKLTQQHCERAIAGARDGLWELEVDGVAWCSPRLGELLGYAPEQFAADTNFMQLFLHPDDAPSVDAVAQAHFQHGEPYDVEFRLRTASGDYRWFRARATAERDARGTPLRLSGSLQDVTAARAAREELLRATQSAAAAGIAKSAPQANLSPEIQTAMSGL